MQKIAVFTIVWRHYLDEIIQDALNNNYEVYILAEYYGPFRDYIYKTHKIIYGINLLDCYEKIYNIFNLPSNQVPEDRKNYWYPTWKDHLPRFGIENINSYFDIWQYNKYGVKQKWSPITVPYQTEDHKKVCES